MINTFTIMKRSPRMLMCGAMLLLGGLGTALDIGQAHAAYTFCRTDPIFTLSNGVQLTLAATIQDDPSDIKQITYTVYVPAGVTLTGTQYTASLGNKEIVKFSSPSAANTYKTGTYVVTYTKGMPVTATTSITRAGAATTANGSVSGSTNSVQWLQIIYS